MLGVKIGYEDSKETAFSIVSDKVTAILFIVSPWQMYPFWNTMMEYNAGKSVIFHFEVKIE